MVSLSLLLEALRGGGVACRVSSITTSLSDLLDAMTLLGGDDLRGEDRTLRGGDRERRRMTSSSTTDEAP